MPGHRATLSLPAAAKALGTPGLAEILLAELTPLLAVHPLLTRAAQQGGRVDAASVRLSPLTGDAVRGGLRLGVFCDEIVAGCNCADPPYAAPLYRELNLQLDPRTATAEIRLNED